MTSNWQDVARATLQGAETDTMTFPQSVKLLMDAGFDGYAVDFRTFTRAYYMPNGDVLALQAERTPAVADRFNAASVVEAIREAQAQAHGYTYKGFCSKVAKAGCAGYIVSLSGKRVLYYGRTGETHTEYFPGTAP